MKRMHALVCRLAVMISLAVAGAAMAAEPLRITQLQRCGDLLDSRQPTFCLQTSGLQQGQWQVYVNGAVLDAKRISRRQDQLRLQIDATEAQSGPLWLQQQGQFSNPVWMSLGSSHILAADKKAVTKNQEGL